MGGDDLISETIDRSMNHSEAEHMLVLEVSPRGFEIGGYAYSVVRSDLTCRYNT